MVSSCKCFCNFTECGPVQNMVVQSEVEALDVSWERPLHTNGAMETYLLRYRHLKLADCEAPKKNWLPIIGEFLFSLKNDYTDCLKS